jgi:hypothetical protein
MPKVHLTCKKGRSRGRRTRQPGATEQNPQPNDGLQMTCECEPSGSKFGIGGCSYPHRARRKSSLVHGTGDTQREED